MPSRHDPADSLADIIENAERIGHDIENVSRGDFGSNGLIRDAPERCLERYAKPLTGLADGQVI